MGGNLRVRLLVDGRQARRWPWRGRWAPTTKQDSIRVVSVGVACVGDADLSNNVFLRFEDPDVAGPHPVFVGDADFCDLLDALR
jgi:hypothetical protein